MTAPINRHTGVGQTVYALIFNGITRASVVTTKLHDGFMPLSERERFAEAVYAELAAGGIEFRLGGRAMLARVAGPPPATEPKPRLRACVEAWPGAETGAYDPRCCRFPKSCSATAYDPEQVTDEVLEDPPGDTAKQARPCRVCQMPDGSYRQTPCASHGTSGTATQPSSEVRP